MSLVPRTKRSEYTGAYKDLQRQIDELRRKIEEIQAKDSRYATIFQPEPRAVTRFEWPQRGPVIDDSTYYTDDD